MSLQVDEERASARQEWRSRLGFFTGRRVLYLGVFGHFLVGLFHLGTNVEHTQQSGRFLFEAVTMLGIPLFLLASLRFFEPLSRRDGDYWRLVTWGVAATTAAFSITALYVVSLRFDGITLHHWNFIAIVAADVGALFGVLAGIQEVRVRQSVRRAQRAESRAHFSEKNRQSLLFLNRMLRHHVLNGLAIVLGKAEQLDDDVPPERAESLETIRDRCEEMVDYVEDIHSATAALSGAMDPAKCDLTDVLETARRATQESYPDARVDASIPSGLRVRGTANLRQVFGHLLENAIVHNDSETPRVRVTATEGDRTVRVTIADDGPGISDESKRAYFGRGEHGEDSLGEGVGLYLAESVISLCDGRIRIEDNEPRGTRVRIELPKPAE